MKETASARIRRLRNSKGFKARVHRHCTITTTKHGDFTLNDTEHWAACIGEAPTGCEMKVKWKAGPKPE